MTASPDGELAGRLGSPWHGAAAAQVATVTDRVLPSATVVGDIATGGDGAAREGRGAPDRETSTRRSLEVLLSLGSDAAIARGGLGVTRIAEMLGREKSQVSRTLKTLADFGLVDRDPDTLAYRLGWRIYALASLAGERRLLDDARPVLRRLVDEFEERAFLSVLQGADTLTILSESPAYAVQAVGWVGRVRRPTARRSARRCC